MTDEGDPAVRGIPKRFRDLSVDVREERLIRYIVKQLSLGRHLDDIMDDREIVAHTSEVTRANLTQNSTVLKAIEEEIKRQFSGYSADTRPDVAESGSD
jgi:hypothetical protein